MVDPILDSRTAIIIDQLNAAVLHRVVIVILLVAILWRVW
jgi:hypothetical protein